MENLKSLIKRAQTGDLDAYNTIVQRFQDMAVGYAYSILGDAHLAEDAAQEAFIEAYRCLSKLRKPEAFPSWFRKIVFKHCDRLTRGRRIKTIPLEAAPEIHSAKKGPAEIVLEQELKDNVLAAIRSLPEKQRIVTTLFYINGYSQNEISDFMGVSVTTVKKQLQYSRKRLKEKLFTVVQDFLQEKRPSKDKRFANKVQLFNAAETGNVDKVKELLNNNATRAALYDFLKMRAEEQREKEKRRKVVRLLKGLDVDSVKQKARGFFKALIDKVLKEPVQFKSILVVTA